MSQELLLKHLLGSILFNTIHSLLTCLLPSCLPVYLSYETGTAFKTSTGFRPLQHNSFTPHLPAAFLSVCLPVYLSYESGTAFKTYTGFHPLHHNSFTLDLPAAFLSACLPVL